MKFLLGSNLKEHPGEAEVEVEVVRERKPSAEKCGVTTGLSSAFAGKGSRGGDAWWEVTWRGHGLSNCQRSGVLTWLTLLQDRSCVELGRRCGGRRLGFKSSAVCDLEPVTLCL